MGVVGRNPFPVSAAADIFNPLGIFKIPANGFTQAGIKLEARLPAKLSFYSATVYGVPEIMPWPVGHICNLIGIRATSRGYQLVKDGAHGQHNLKIGLFRMFPQVGTSPPG